MGAYAVFRGHTHTHTHVLGPRMPPTGSVAGYGFGYSQCSHIDGIGRIMDHHHHYPEGFAVVVVVKIRMFLQGC
jgi:hypothetical protein